MPQYFNFALNKTSIYYADGVNYNIAATPLYFVRSGGIYLDAGTAGGPHFGAMGGGGRFWSSRSDSTTANAYGLYLDVTGVYQSRSSDRWRGLSLRCLSTVLEM